MQWATLMYLDSWAWLRLRPDPFIGRKPGRRRGIASCGVRCACVMPGNKLCRYPSSYLLGLGCACRLRWKIPIPNATDRRRVAMPHICLRHENCSARALRIVLIAWRGGTVSPVIHPRREVIMEPMDMDSERFEANGSDEYTPSYVERDRWWWNWQAFFLLASLFNLLFYTMRWRLWVSLRLCAWSAEEISNPWGKREKRKCFLLWCVWFVELLYASWADVS
jgi:hypothetical protein